MIALSTLKVIFGELDTHLKTIITATSVIRADEGGTVAKRPAFPFVAYKIMTTTEQEGWQTGRTVTENQSDPLLADINHQINAQMSLSVTAFSRDTEEAYQIAEAAYRWLGLTGKEIIDTENVVLRQMSVLNDRTVRMGNETENKWGFDVRLDETQNVVSTVVAIDIPATLEAMELIDTTPSPPSPPVFDPEVKTLLHLNADFSDSSQSAHVFSAVGDTVIKTDNYKYGGGSAFFDNVNDYIEAPTHDDWNLSNRDFTIDVSVRPTSQGAIDGVISRSWGISNWAWQLLIWSAANKISFFYSNDGVVAIEIPWTVILPNLVWSHVRLVRSGSSAYLFIEGLSQGAKAISGSINDNNGALQIGSQPFNNYHFHGYKDEFRLLHRAESTSNFPVPTGEFSPYV